MGNIRQPSTLDLVAIWTSPITSSISLVSSSTILFLMISDREAKLKKPNNRFLLMMSIFDIIQSLAYASVVLPLPVDSGVYGAHGNHWTCAIQGVFIQIGFSVPCYNACLCIWYWTHIKHNIDPEDLNQFFNTKYNIASRQTYQTVNED